MREDMGEAAVAVETTETETEAESGKSDIREKILQSLKERKTSAADKSGDSAKEAKPDPVPDGEKPEKPEGEEEKPTEDEPAAALKKEREDFEKELGEHKAEKRKFTRHKRKTEARLDARDNELKTREAQITVNESRAKEELESFDRDPLTWLEKRGVPVRDKLLEWAQRDTEDPRDKKIRELDERSKRQEETDRKRGEAEEKRQKEAETAEAKRKEEETKGKRENAIRQLRTNLQSAYETADAAEFPYLNTLSTPESVGRAAAQRILEHYEKTDEALDAVAVFRMLESELRSHDQQLEAARKKAAAATGKRPEPPEQVRTVAKREPVSPEPTRRVRASEDVTNRVTRVQTVSDVGKSSFNKETTRERLLEMTRARLKP